MCLFFTASLAWGADVKISELPAATAPDGTELVPIVQSLTTKKTTIADVLNTAGSTTYVVASDWTTIDNYPATCTNQFVRALGDTNTCASVVYTDITAMTSANFAGLVSDESGTGVICFTTSPVFTTPNIGSATGSIDGNAGTATALAADPANCSAGQIALGVTAAGVAECTATPSGLTSVGATTFTGNLTGNASGSSGSCTGNSATATAATTVTITDNESTAENNPIVFVADADPDGGNLGLESDGTCYYTPSTGVITTTGFAGALTGNVTGNVSGSSGSCTGNAATATALETTRAIGGVNFNGTAAITPTTIVVADTEDATAYIGIWDSATGSLLPKTDEQITYAADTGILTAVGFAGSLTGAVTGNASTASALAADPTDCGAGVVATAIAANGNLTCSIDPIVSTEIDTFSELDTIVADKILASSDSTNTFTNKTFDASATGNSLKIYNTADCSSYVANGQLCQDTDDDKLYKGTGAAVEEVGAKGDTGATGATGPAPAGQIFLSSAGGWPSTTSGCQTNTLSETTTNKVNYWTLNFDASTVENAEGSLMMPSDWDAGTVTVIFEWLADDATTNYITWCIKGRCWAEGTAIDSAYGDPVCIPDANNSTVYQVHYTSSTSAITLPEAGANRSCSFKIFRDADEAITDVACVGAGDPWACCSGAGAGTCDSLAVDGKLKGVMVAFTRT